MVVDLAGCVALVVGSETGPGRAVAQVLRSNGAIVEDVTTGVLDESFPACGSRIDDTIGRLGALHLFVNACALADIDDGSGGPEAFGRALVRMDALTTAAGAAMAARGSGRIVNLLSVLGLLPARTHPRTSIGHAALVALTRTKAMSLAPRGVLVNALAIGAVESQGEDLVDHVPLGRSGRLDEVAAAALFLLDPANTYTVGHVLAVDGGWQAGYARNF